MFLPLLHRRRLRSRRSNRTKRFLRPEILGLLLSALGICVGLAIAVFGAHQLWQTVAVRVSNQNRFRVDPFNSQRVTTTLPSVGLKAALESNPDGAKVSVRRQDSELRFSIPLSNPTLSTTDQAVTFWTDQKLVTVEYSLLENGLKEDIVLTADPQTTVFGSQLELKNATPHVNAEGQLLFYDKEGTYQFHFETPYAVDAAGQVTYGVRYHLLPKDADLTTLEAELQKQQTASNLPSESTNSTAAAANSNASADSSQKTTQLLGEIRALSTQDSQEYTLVVEVAKDWLTSPARQYPIRIDPTVVHDESSEFSGGTFARSYDAGSGSSPFITTRYSESVLDESVVGYWPMNESSGTTVADISQYGNNGTTATSIVTGPDTFGNARSFSTTTSQVTISHNNRYSFERTDPLTIEAWVKTNSDNGGFILGKLLSSSPYTGWAIYYYGSYADSPCGHHRFLFEIINTWSSNTLATCMSGQSQALNDNVWHHIAITYNGNSKANGVKIYIDGQLQPVEFRFDSLTATSTSTANLFFGYSSYSNSFIGSLDEVKISRVERTADEIKAAAKRYPSSLFTSDTIDLGTDTISLNSLSWEAYGAAAGDGEVPFDNSDLIVQWDFDETSGTSVNKSAGSCSVSHCTGTINLAQSEDYASQDGSDRSYWTSANRRWGSGAIHLSQDDWQDESITFNLTSLASYIGSDPFTVSTWIKPEEIDSYDSTHGVQIIRSTNTQTNQIGDFVLALGNKGQLIFYNWRNTGADTDGRHETAQGVIKPNQWHHIVAIWDGSDNQLFVNGKEVSFISTSTTTTDFQTYPETYGLKIGRSVTSGTEFFHGFIDTTQVFGRALSESEILSNYNSSQLVFETRTSADGSTWESWQPLSSTNISTSNWSVDNPNDNSLSSIYQTTDSVLTTSGTGSIKLETGRPHKDSHTINKYSTTTVWDQTEITDEIDYLVVAGGGGGGGVIAGGGGAGGVLSAEHVDVTDCEYLEISVGSGGGGGTGWNTAGQQGTKGGTSYIGCYENPNTSFIATVSGGGGGGPFGGSSSCSVNTANGGSGGGSARGSYPCSGTGISGQGNDGGDSPGENNGGGGGGAGAAGQDGIADTQAGNGGIGYLASMLGFDYYVGGGGGGGTRSGYGIAGTGGQGGGGNGTTTSTVAKPGKPQTGGGGGGAGYNAGSSSVLGGSGGSGVIYIKYPVSNPVFNHLVAYWSFDETSGSGEYITDLSENENHGNPSGGANTQGVVSRAHQFATNTDFISFGEATPELNFDRDDPFSVEFWMKTDSSSGGDIFGYLENDSPNTGYHLWYYGDPASSGCSTNQLNFQLINTYPTNMAAVCVASSGATNLLHTGWHHIVITYDGSSLASGIQIFIDGQTQPLYVQSNSLTASIQGTNTFVLGHDLNQGFVGSIDEFKIYDIELTQSAADQLYRLGRGYSIEANITYSSSPSTPVNFSGTGTSPQDILSFDIAADRPGTYLSLTAANSSQAGLLPDQNTVALWRFEETNGQGAFLKDSSGNGNHASSVNTNSSGGAPNTGVARSFNNSTSSYISIPATTDLDLQTLTISAWVYSDNFAQNMVLFEKTANGDTNSQYTVYFNASGEFIFRTVNSSLAIDYLTVSDIQLKGIQNGAWNHIVTTYDGSTKRVYFNGIEVARADYSETLNTSSVSNPQSATSRIGVSHYPSYPFDGSIDEVKVDSVALSLAEIRAAYEAGIGIRSLPITIEFGAHLQASDLANNDADHTFTIDATDYGLAQAGSGILPEETIIIRENVGGTTYTAFGTVSAVVKSTGAITIANWNLDSTFPSSGYSERADVFKWQRVYWNLRDSTVDDDLDDISKIRLMFTNNAEGRTVWLDNFQAITGGLSTPAGSSPTSTGQRYLQYRAILSSWDQAVSAGISSVTLDYSTSSNEAPTAPTNLLTNDQTNPTGISTLIPYFSAIYTDPDSGDTADAYQIQISTDASFTQNLETWSGATSVSEGNRSGNISYGGSQLSLNGQTYYWRIRFTDDDGAVGPWSNETATFTMFSLPRPTNCKLDQTIDNGTFTLSWEDLASTETGYEIQRLVDGGSWTTLTTAAADTTSYPDSTITPSSSYTYRVRAVSSTESVSSEWCTTAVLNPDEDSFLLEGLQVEGIRLN